MGKVWGEMRGSVWESVLGTGFPIPSPTSPFTSPTPQHTFPHLPHTLHTFTTSLLTFLTPQNTLPHTLHTLSHLSQHFFTPPHLSSISLASIPLQPNTFPHLPSHPIPLPTPSDGSDEPFCRPTKAITIINNFKKALGDTDNR